MSEKPTVFVVDDDQAVRSALHFALESSGFKVELHANAHEFLESYDLDRPGCLVLDVRMPGMSGLDLQKELESRRILLPVIFLTGHGDPPMAVRAFKQGAVDFLEKPFDNAVLMDRIREAFKINAEMRHRATRMHELQQRLDRLTPQEQEVLDGILAGHSNKVMAADAGVTISTIEKRRRRLMKKMEAKNLAELVWMGLSSRSAC